MVPGASSHPENPISSGNSSENLKRPFKDKNTFSTFKICLSYGTSPLIKANVCTVPIHSVVCNKN